MADIGYYKRYYCHYNNAEEATTTFKAFNPSYGSDTSTIYCSSLQSDSSELNRLLSHLNSQISTVRFTSTQSMESVDFLDLTLYKGPRFPSTGKLDIRPFSKKIDPHSYLHFSSAHHPTITWGIVKGEVIRMLRRSSSPKTFTIGMQQLLKWFTDKGYPKKLLKEVADSVTFQDRENYLRYKEKKTLPEMTTVLSVRNHQAISCMDLRNALTDEDLPFRPMVTRRRPPNTGDLLVRAQTHDYPLRSKGREL